MPVFYLQIMKPWLKILSRKSHVEICVSAMSHYRKQPEAVTRERNYRQGYTLERVVFFFFA